MSRRVGPGTTYQASESESVNTSAFLITYLVSLPTTRLEPSRPAADATREVVERWLLDGLM